MNNWQSPRGEKGKQTVKTNQFELSGYVGNTPEVRFTPNGKADILQPVHQGALDRQQRRGA